MGKHNTDVIGAGNWSGGFLKRHLSSDRLYLLGARLTAFMMREACTDPLKVGVTLEVEPGAAGTGSWVM